MADYKKITAIVDNGDTKYIDLDPITRDNLVSILKAIQDRSQWEFQEGLLTIEDKRRLDAIWELFGETDDGDASTTVDTLKEVLKILENFPESDNLKDILDTINNKINGLNLTQVGSDGSYIKYISQEAGQVHATEQAFDTIISRSNPSTTNAPTDKAVKDYADSELLYKDNFGWAIANTTYTAGTYHKGAIVYYNGYFYECIVDSTSADPTDNTKWANVKIESLIDRKVAKSTTSSTFYGKDANGNEDNIFYSSDYNNKAWQAVIRDNNSDVLVPTTPTTDNAAASKKHVADSIVNAVNALDITDITNTAGKTISKITEANGKIGAEFQDISIVSSQISDKAGIVYDPTNDTNKSKVATSETIKVALETLHIENGSGTNSLQQKGNTASGKDSFAQGLGNIASNIQSHAEGFTTQAVGNFAHSEGQYTIAWADISHTEGVGNVVGDLTEFTVRGTGIGGHAEGLGNRVLGEYAHAEGFGTTAKGNYSHSNGVGANDLSGSPEVAVGKYDTGNYIKNTNVGHGISYDATNNITYISGARFGDGTQTFNDFKARLSAGDKVNFVHVSSSGEIGSEVEIHSIGADYFYIKGQQAWNNADIALKIEYKVREDEVYSGTAYGVGSFATGFHNVAMQDYQTVVGKYNNNKLTTLFEVGNGVSNNIRSNAFEVYEDGHAEVALMGSTNKSVATKEYADTNFANKRYVDNTIAALPKPMLYKGTVGTNGTITALPTASAANEGFTYKVATTGTYDSQSAKVGDTFISNGSTWTLIPSGDDIEDTWRQINVNGTQLLGTGLSTGAINFKNGGHITVTGSGNNITLGTESGYQLVQLPTTAGDYVLTVSGSGNNLTYSYKEFKGVPYLTTAPTTDNTNGQLIFVVLSAEPTTRYNGYFYIITE